MKQHSGQSAPPRRGTRFSIFISTAVIAGIGLIYLIISTINSYAFNSIIQLNAENMLRQNLTATEHEIHGFIKTTSSSLKTLQAILSSGTDTEQPSQIQQLLFSQLLNIPQVTGVMFANPNGDFIFIKRHTDTATNIPHDQFIKNGYSVKKILNHPRRKVSIDYYSGDDLRLIVPRSLPDLKDDTYDPRERVWYKNALSKQKIVWSKPYIFFTSAKPGITVSAPVMQKKKLAGIVGLDIELDALSGFINKLTRQTFQSNNSQQNNAIEEEPEAVIFIAEDTADSIADNVIVAHTGNNLNIPITIPSKQSSKLTLLRMGQLPFPAMRKGAEEFSKSKKKQLFGSVSTNQQHKYYYMFHSCRSNECSLKLAAGFTIPYSNISGNITSFVKDMQLTLLIAGIICLICGLYVARHFINPINKLSELAGNIAKLDFSNYPPIKYTPFFELNTAINTFDNMWNSLKNYRHKNIELSDQLKKSYRETILRLAAAAEYKDKETHDHLARMSEYSALLAGKIGMSDNEIEMMRFAAPMHDIGKIGIPDAILLKPGRYTPEEFEVMKKHPGYGHKLLQPPESEIMLLSASIALNHHERFDGTGYPAGKHGDSIPLEAQIVALADVYDALRSKRCYKEAIPHEKVLEIIREERGKHFSPRIVDAFLEIHELIYEISCHFPTAPVTEPALS